MTIDQDVGVMYIAEETSPEQNIVKDMKVHHDGDVFYVEFESCIHSFDVMNRNSRMYEAANIEQCLKTERIQHYLSHGGWFGEMNHPTPKYKDMPLAPERIRDIDMNNTSHKMLNPHVERNLLISKIQTDSGTAAGMNLARKMVQGFIPGFSCRAIATMNIKNSKPVVNVRQIITYDWVLFQSHREAEQITSVDNKFITKNPEGNKVVTTNHYVSEAADIAIPMKDLIGRISATDPNAQVLMESFDLDEDSVMGFTRSRKQMIIRDQDTNTIYCNINQSSKRLVDDFFRSFGK